MKVITITPGVRGFVVQIGCQVCGFSNVQDLREALNEYLGDPEGCERKYYPQAEPQAIARSSEEQAEVTPPRPELIPRRNRL